MKKKKKSAPDSRRVILVVFLALVVVVLAVVFFRGGGQEQIQARKEAPAEKGGEPAAGPAESRVVTLFFASEDDNRLYPEERKIPAGASDADDAARVVQELIKGSTGSLLPALPPGTRLRRLFITKEGIAYVDFSKEIASQPTGSEEELATVYSVVNTLAYNFKSIKRVFLLVEGAEKETLGGHVNLGEAFAPQFSLDAR